MKLPALAISLIAFSFAACNRAHQLPSGQTSTNQNQSSNCVNLNQAGADELKALPEIGEAMAQKIIDYRKRHAGFRRPQELIIIEGFSEKKYRAIAALVCVK